ncbi:serine/threonine-protein kinase [Streptomyces sporangiiformans]|uniref:non-specific serine/threonine protein kinase n=1 Tax=Streptomyces sporangiiformans TaxID=2315329 RepID=A0A505DAM5_9ACTN|nr:serine/threonine-protein kinase [Streptomyces sporangiiformans]TPQ18775.1 serine/threonine protein kinase [Streptomyces sporangiiformans]
MQGLLLSERYRLVDAIGSGGMGRVWRAHDEVLHRAVAIKELTAALYVSESDQGVLLARTRAEARAAARINHSAVVTVHDVLEHDGRPWIVMELVEGRSLADAVKESGRIEPQEAARIGLWVLRALRAAHSAGVLHRDIKPGNVLLSDDRRVLLTDFGIAQVEGDTTITRTGEIVGSVDYLAPERVRGHDPGPSSDLWALGATLYTAVEGKSPFRRTTPLTTMQAVVTEEPGEAEHAGPLAPVITALLRKDPADRPGAEEAEHMLAEAAEGRTPSAAQAYVPTEHVSHSDTHGWPSASEPTAVTPHQPMPGYQSAPGHQPWPGHQPMPGHQSVPGQQPTSGHQHISGTQPASGHQMPAGPAGPGKRRRGRTIALVVAVAALVGGGGAAAMRYADDWRQTDGSSSSSSSSSSSEENGENGEVQTGAVPENWVRVQDPKGFSLVLPEGWKRQAVDEFQTDYTPDGGEHFVRIAVDDSPDFDSPYEHQLDLEQQLQRLRDYKRVSLEANVYRDRPGSLWDFSWIAQAKDTPFPGPRRAIEETYLSRDGVEYAIYVSGPAEDWETTREQFDAILRGWRPKGDTAG